MLRYIIMDLPIFTSYNILIKPNHPLDDAFFVLEFYGRNKSLSRVVARLLPSLSFTMTNVQIAMLSETRYLTL